MYPGDLAIFVPALHPAKKCSNGRLPRITQRDVSTLVFWTVYNRPIEPRSVGSFPGAACSHTFGGTNDEANAAE